MSIYRGDQKFKNKCKEMTLRENKKNKYLGLLSENYYLLLETKSVVKRLQKKEILTTMEKQKFKKCQNEVYRLERYCMFLRRKVSRFD